jgi:hypothetical protein
MALTERSRAALFRGLSDVLDDEEAVGELLSYFPARDADEPASRDFVDARIANVEARISGVDGRIDGLDGRMDGLDGRIDGLAAKVEALGARMDAGFASVDARFASLEDRMVSGFTQVRAELRSDLHDEVRSFTRWAVGSIVAAVGLLVALGLIG